MKKILLMRHAKSSWAENGLRDFDRPLNNRGHRDAPRMGRYLAGLALLPDQIFASPAARAKATVNYVAQELALHESLIEWDEDLYYGGPHSYLDALRQADEKSSLVMTVGHNPITEEVIRRLAGADRQVPTAAITCLETDIGSWSELEPGKCRFLWMMKPKELQD